MSPLLAPANLCTYPAKLLPIYRARPQPLIVFVSQNYVSCWSVGNRLGGMGLPIIAARPFMLSL
jgi:hypothetical protein